MADFLIRDAGPADAAAIADLHVASWNTAYRGMVSDAALDDLTPADFEPMWTDVLTEMPGNVQGAWQGEQLLGFVCAGPIADRDPDQVLDGFIHALHVAPALKGKGIGKALLHAGFCWLLSRDCTMAGLWVFEKNLASRMFYKRMGGEDVARQMTDVLGEDVPEIGMQWDLAHFQAAEGTE